tara:strand:+ start:65438 stop:65608 length:171 start_codon:yes stop_codon:yes gene_type:complete
MIQPHLARRFVQATAHWQRLRPDCPTAATPIAFPQPDEGYGSMLSCSNQTMIAMAS